MSALVLEKLPTLARLREGGGINGGAVDLWLIGTIMTLLAVGLVMVSSASIHYSATLYGNPWHVTIRQAVFAGIGLLMMAMVLQLSVAFWERWGAVLFLVGLLMLMLVLIPGIGVEKNGATRWINLGVINVQVSELVKLFVVVYIAGYLVRRAAEVRATVKGFIKPMVLLSVVALLLLLEPDFGATVIIMATVLGMMFLGGVRLWQYGILISAVAVAMSVLAVTSPYRMQRLTAFLNPWADAEGGGYQLINSLVAIGRGEFAGVGLGGAMQKLSYLPEAHTDFIFAILAEELGLIGSLLVIGLFSMLVVRAFLVARRAESNGMQFGAYMAYGLGIWFGLQAFVNIGVNLGMLPTKGLTLPLVSYGGSSIVVSCIAMGVLLRVDYESRKQALTAARRALK